MAGESLGTVVSLARSLGAGPGQARPPDRDLLDRFVAGRDEAAFEALVRRHGPMVLGACRRVLRDAHDAEDACQATFLVLARKAASVRERDALAGWLHGVAVRVARRAREDAVRRRPRVDHPTPVPQTDAASEATWREVRAVLDEELDRLPARYRAALVLCYLEGLTRDEAAARLGWTPGTLRGRLERGRERLRAALARRGLTLGVALSAAALSEARAAVPPTFVLPTVNAATLVAARDFAAAAGVVPGRVVALTERVLRAMLIVRLKVGAVLVFAALGTAASAFLPASAGPADKPAPSAVGQMGPAKGKVPAGLEAKLVGTWVGRGMFATAWTFRADGTFRRDVLNLPYEGTWALEWDALPPTLILRVTKSDDEAVPVGTVVKQKVVGLDGARLAFESPTPDLSGGGVLSYKRVEDTPPAGGTPAPKGGTGLPNAGQPARADVTGEWRNLNGLAGVFLNLDLKDDGTFTLDRWEVDPKLQLVTTGTWALDGDRVILREERQVRDGQPVAWGDGMFFPRGRTDALAATRKGGGWVLTHGKDLEFVRPRAAGPKGDRTRP